jgi:hypothetical protein
MVRLAQRLPVVAIPEQMTISLVRLDVIDHGGLFDFALC